MKKIIFLFINIYIILIVSIFDSIILNISFCLDIYIYTFAMFPLSVYFSYQINIKNKFDIYSTLIYLTLILFSYLSICNIIIYIIEYIIISHLTLIFLIITIIILIILSLKIKFIYKIKDFLIVFLFSVIIFIFVLISNIQLAKINYIHKCYEIAIVKGLSCIEFNKNIKQIIDLK